MQTMIYNDFGSVAPGHTFKLSNSLRSVIILVSENAVTPDRELLLRTLRRSV